MLMQSRSAYNICIIQPKGYVHSLAFLEVAELITYSLRELGKSAVLRINHIDAKCRNIVIGCHLLSESALQSLPRDTVMLNTEQIRSVSAEWRNRVMLWASSFETWDYSNGNIEVLRASGAARVRHFRIGWQKELARICPVSPKDIDVLFYGSVNQRRSAILGALRQAGLVVKTVFGVYGEERDALISRSKIVLNLHLYDAKLFEIVRVFYLMTNSVAVVAEVGPDTLIESEYLAGLCAVPYEGLVDACAELVADEGMRSDLEARALRTIRGLPQTTFTREVLTS